MVDRVGQVWRLTEETDEGLERFVAVCLIVSAEDYHPHWYMGLILDDADPDDVGCVLRMDRPEAFKEPSTPLNGSRFRWERVS